MTVKRDLKRRVRLRQARTGEAYVTARRHVLAARADGDGDGDADPEATPETEPADGDHPGAEPLAAEAHGAEADDAASSVAAAAAVGEHAPEADAPGGPASREVSHRDPGAIVSQPASDAATPASDPAAPADPTVPVIEMVDVSDEAKRHGFLCRVVMFPALVRLVDIAHVLGRLHGLLIEMSSDPEAQVLTRMALTGLVPNRPMPSLHSFWHVRRLVQRARAGMGGIAEDGFALTFHVAGRDGIVPVLCGMSWHDALLVLMPVDELALENAALAPSLGIARSLGRTLFVVHAGRVHPIRSDEFVIGRDPRAVDLAIDDPRVSDRHAAVIRRHGAHYLKDLGSSHGITYKGMHIDNKRIEAGDVFEIGGHAIRFTFQPEAPR